MFKYHFPLIIPVIDNGSLISFPCCQIGIVLPMVSISGRPNDDGDDGDDDKKDDNSKEDQTGAEDGDEHEDDRPKDLNLDLDGK